MNRESNEIILNISNKNEKKNLILIFKISNKKSVTVVSFNNLILSSSKPMLEEKKSLKVAKLSMFN